MDVRHGIREPKIWLNAHLGLGLDFENRSCDADIINDPATMRGPN